MDNTNDPNNPNQGSNITNPLGTPDLNQALPPLSKEPSPEIPWPSSAAPQTPLAADPMATSPFLQPQTPPTAPLQNAPTLTSVPATENIFQPNQGLPQDPLNTAFTPGANPNEPNPFGPSETPPENPAAPPAAEQPPESQPSGSALPEMGPVENAPTDLSHLIAGDELHQQPGDIYNPPVAPDQNPAVNPTQTPTETEGGEPPHGKHLNITKVLLVVGIPIILIVAALSAYLILGIGKSAPEEKTTSLPIETQQAPLTNPPQQVVQPSPSTLPQPQTSTAPSTGSATLPVSSSSPASALEQLKARQSASPSPSGL